MFIIFNKDKILSYLISISTVAILFVMSFAITKNNNNTLNETLKTSTNVIQNETSANVIQNETKEQAINTIQNTVSVNGNQVNTVSTNTKQTNTVSVNENQTNTVSTNANQTDTEATKNNIVNEVNTNKQ